MRLKFTKFSWFPTETKAEAAVVTAKAGRPAGSPQDFQRNDWVLDMMKQRKYFPHSSDKIFKNVFNIALVGLP